MWKKVGKDMYEQRTKHGSHIVYIMKWKNGYVLNYGQAPMNYPYDFSKTKKEALKDLERYKNMHRTKRRKK